MRFPSDKVTPPTREIRSPSSAQVPDVDPAEEMDRIILEEHGGGSLERMHERSQAIRVDRNRLLTSNYASDRKGLVQWLMDGFEWAHLKDEWLIATISLMDRVLAGPQSSSLKLKRRSSSENDPMAKVLAVVLCVLKMSASDEELGMNVRDAIFRVARKHPTGLWQQIIDAELTMCIKLGFKVGVPSFADLLSRVMIDIVVTAKKSINANSWPGLATEALRLQHADGKASTPQIVSLGDFLLELAIVHAHREVYQEGLPPIVLAFAIARLALLAFGAPPAACITMLKNTEIQVLGAENADRLIMPLALTLHRTWKVPPVNSGVISKWRRRQQFQLLQLPLAPETFPPQLDELDAMVCTPPKPSRRDSPAPTSAPRIARPDRNAGHRSEFDLVTKTTIAPGTEASAKVDPSIPSRVGLRSVKRFETGDKPALPSNSKGKRKFDGDESSKIDGAKLDENGEKRKLLRLRRMSSVCETMKTFID